MLDCARCLGDRSRLAEAHIRQIGVSSSLEMATQTWGVAVQLFRDLSDAAGEARAHREFAYVRWVGGDYPGSLGANFRSLDIHRRLGDRRGEAGDVGNIAQVYLGLRNLDEALRWAKEAVRMYQALGDKVGEAMRTHAVATVHRERGELEAALGLNGETLRLHAELGFKPFMVTQHSARGVLQLALGVPDRALDNFRVATQLSQAIGDVKEEGNAWLGVGISLEQLADFAAAATAYQRATHLLDIACRVSGLAEDAAAQADVLSLLAKLFHHKLDQPQKALDSYRAASEIVRELGDDVRLRKLLLGMAGSSWRLGKLEDAVRAYEKALSLARAHQDAVHEAAALASLGVVHRDLGSLKRAIRSGRQALKLLRELEDSQAEAYVLSSLAESYRRLGRSSGALACLHRSLRLRRDIGDEAGEVGVLGELSNLYGRLGNRDCAQVFVDQARLKRQSVETLSGQKG